MSSRYVLKRPVMISLLLNLCWCFEYASNKSDVTVSGGGEHGNGQIFVTIWIFKSGEEQGFLARLNAEVLLGPTTCPTPTKPSPRQSELPTTELGFVPNKTGFSFQPENYSKTWNILKVRALDTHWIARGACLQDVWDFFLLWSKNHS